VRNRLTEIIKLYKKNYGADSDGCILYAKNQKTLANAIKISTSSIDEDGNKHGHQNRIPHLVLELWNDAVLQKLSSLKKVKSFDEILCILRLARIHGIGELTIYDTASRIGAFLNLFPNKIYLHAGTKIGAKNLLGKVSANYILKTDLPKQFRRSDLACWEIEDILCIFKDVINPSLNEISFHSRCLNMESGC
jgi:hypothetical protein